MKTFVIIIILFFRCILSSEGFALLSHEAIIDTCWEKSIKPLLHIKYPSASEEQLKEAHSYLFGGSIISDIGYYPFGSKLFTHLLHYVRSGDFIMEVLSDAKDINEYAFGLGLMCHYFADKYGHSLGTNLAVPLLFPKAKTKYGNSVTYEQAPILHMRTEFGFDVLETAKGKYETKKQHDFIGFKVSEEVLERAFFKIYGIKLNSIFKSLPLAIESFRFIVKQMFPELTKDAWKVRKSVITKLNPLAQQAGFRQTIDKKNYNKDFGKPRIQSVLLTVIIGLIPKIGPFKALKFKEPTEEVEKLFNSSFDAILYRYSTSLALLKTGQIVIENINFDTGNITKRGEYHVADDCYYTLLNKHMGNKFENVNKELKKNILEFYFSTENSIKYKIKPYKVRTIAKNVLALKKWKT